MNVISIYIVKEILKGSLIALLVLLTLFNLFTFADELKDIGKGHYGLQEIIYYIGLTSPTVIYELVPAAGLIGSLFVLGAMGNNRELVAMQASGLSPAGIIRIVLLSGVFLVVFALAIGEYVAPTAERLGQKIRATALGEQFIASAKYGIWLREKGNFINVRKIMDDGKLADISIYEIDDYRHLQSAIHADKATHQNKQTWTLENIEQSRISTEQILVDQEKARTWQSSIAPDLLKIVVVNPDNLSLYDLAMYIDFLKTNHQKSHAYQVSFWGRAFSPITTFIMLLVSAPFVIGIHRGVSVGARIMLGVTVGIGFNIFDKIVNHLGLIYNLNPLLMAIIPNLIVLSLILWTIKKVRV